MRMIIDKGESTLSDFDVNYLARSVEISLFSWRRAEQGEVPEGANRNGWWGDTFSKDPIGSKLWLLMHKTIQPDTLVLAKEYCAEALAWLIEDKIAEKVEVDTFRTGPSDIGISVAIFKPNHQKLAMRFEQVWELSK